MTEALLVARLAVLKRNLQVTRRVSVQEKSELVLSEAIEAEAWLTAFGQLASEALRLDGEIDELQSELDSGKDTMEGWASYRVVRDATQRTCRDCLELVGGFALREKLLEDADDQLLDRRVTAVTEAIVGICRSAHYDLRGLLALPAPEDAVSRTMAGIVRARFPDWTVWSLPAAAYEYAHVVLDDIPPLEVALDDERRLRLKDEGLTERSLRGRERAAQLKLELPMLFADAFAARVMGPAYACAMVVLRFDPLRDRGGAPADLERAEVIFEVLRRTSPPSASGPFGVDSEAPWRFVRDEVAPRWREVVKEGGAAASRRRASALHPSDRARGFVDRNWNALRNGIAPEAVYPYQSFRAESWANAHKVAERWETDLPGGVTPSFDGARGFRDALNAAWICRIRHPESTDLLTRWTRSACDAILRRDEPSPSGDKPEARQESQPA